MRKEGGMFVDLYQIFKRETYFPLITILSQIMPYELPVPFGIKMDNNYFHANFIYLFIFKS
jgi:hypothetical protein